MKSKYPKNKTIHDTQTLAYSRSPCLDEIERMAVAIDEATRTRQPDENSEIRQDAVLIQLNWYLKQHCGSVAGGARKRQKRHRCWNFPSAAARALKYAKLRYFRRLAAESRIHEPLTDANGGVCRHAADQPLWSLPKAVRRVMALCCIRRAANRGLISAGNAKVAKLVLEDQMSIKRVADQLGVTPGAIYQQLTRVGEVLPAVMEEIEVPTFGIG